MLTAENDFVIIIIIIIVSGSSSSSLHVIVFRNYTLCIFLTKLVVLFTIVYFSSTKRSLYNLSLIYKNSVPTSQ
jgi:hypothetical protein